MHTEVLVPLDRSVLSEFDQELTLSILTKLDDYKPNASIPPVLFSFESLYAELKLDSAERPFVERIIGIQPAAFGFYGSYFGIDGDTPAMTKLLGQTYQRDGQQRIITTQYLPIPVFEAYTRLNDGLYSDTRRRLLVESGYRSPAYQFLVLLHYLRNNDFSMERTLRRVAMPGYSEHGAPHRQGIDFITELGIPTHCDPYAFASTEEFKWLTENGSAFGFEMTYFQGNPDGIAYEPWHWGYRGV